MTSNITSAQHAENLHIIAAWQDSEPADDSVLEAHAHATLGKLLRMASDGTVMDARTVNMIAYAEQDDAELYQDDADVAIQYRYAADVLFALARKLH